MTVRWSLFRHFALIVLLISGTLLGISLFGNHLLVTDHIRAVMDRAMTQTEVELHRVFDPIETAVTVSHRWIQDGLVDRHDQEGLLGLFLPLLHRTPQCGSMMVSDMSGYEFLIMRYSPEGLLEEVEPEGYWVTRDFRRDERGTSAHWALWDKNGSTRIKEWETELDYDPRPRVWHAGPRSEYRERRTVDIIEDTKGSIYWTEIDIFFTSKTSGLTASIAVRDPSGDLVVLGFDLLLSDLSIFTSSMRPTDRGVTFIMTDEGNLVGLPRDERRAPDDPGLDRLLEPVEDSGFVGVAESMPRWRERESDDAEPVRVQGGGESWWAEFRPFRISDERLLWVGVVLPESDVLSESRNDQVMILVTGLFSLVIATILAARASRKFASPLGALVSQSERIAALDLEAGEAVESDLLEIQRLSETLAGMRRSLASHIDERERVSAALAESQRTLEARVEDRTAELEKARSEADQANRAKSRFLANMSHELRTPLNAIIGYSEILQEEVRDGDPDQLETDLERIRSSGRHLLELINDILDLSRVEAGGLVLFPKTFDIAGLCREVEATIAPLASQRSLALDVDCADDLGTIHADRIRLKECLLNLLSNACKFTEVGSISLEARRDGDEVVFIVADTGIGIAPEDVERVFDAFSQTEPNKPSEFGGSGLGLSITRRLCDLMGGQITLESEVGKGSTFTMRLSDSTSGSRPTPAPAIESPPQPRPAGKDQGTVLVIDDDPAIRDLVARHLGQRGYEVVAAANGHDGLDIARRIEPKAILLDVLMPGIDGWTVLRRLKEDPRTAVIPTILTTILDEQRFGLSLGAADYLVKPIDRGRLVAVIERHESPRGECRALIVDDDATSRELLTRVIVGEGWSVIEAPDARSALDRLEEVTVDLVLLDLVMPIMDGFEFARALRRREEWRSIPVVVVTGKDLTEQDRQALADDVQEILTKGALDGAELLGEIREILDSIRR